MLALLALLFAGLVAWSWWVHRHSITDMSPERKRLALGIRIAILAFIILALAGLRFVRKSDSVSVIFLLDASRSVRDDQKQQELGFVRGHGGARNLRQPRGRTGARASTASAGRLVQQVCRSGHRSARGVRERPPCLIGVPDMRRKRRILCTSRSTCTGNVTTQPINCVFIWRFGPTCSESLKANQTSEHPG
jgi:hypothetical protein